MVTLQLKDICSYIPYGLKCKYSDEDTIWTIDPMAEETNHDDSVLQIFHLTESDGSCQPILRPMSNLTKPITHKGETFVPIVELAKINNPEYTSVEINGKGRVFINTPYVENMTMVYDWINAIFLNLTIRKDGSCRLETSRAARNQQPLFDKLSEWQFDFRGLLDAGLAIPVTNEFNPYK